MMAAWVDDGIVTDRPDFTEASTSVGARVVQFETGLTFSRQPGAQALSGPEALLRLGLTARTELRVGLPDQVRQREGGVWRSGFGDAYVGAKFQLGPLPGGVDLSLIPAVRVPSGSADFSSRGLDPELKICASGELGGAFTLSGMCFVSNPTDPQTRRRDTTVQATLSLGQSIGGAALFYEVAHTDPRSGPAERLFHTGVTWQPAPGRQWDLHGGFDLSHPARGAFLGLGYSWKR